MPPLPPARPGLRFVPRADPLEDRLTPAARVQFLNAAAFPGTNFLDVYVNGSLVRDNLVYGSATSLIPDVPAGVPVRIDIARGDSTSSANPLVSLTRTLADNSDTLFAPVGDPRAAAGSPTAFRVREFSPVRTTTPGGQGTTGLLAFNASADSGALDFAVRDRPTFAPNLGFGQFGPGYAGVPADLLSIDLSPAGSEAPTKAYQLDLRASAGSAVVLAALGFTDPATAGAVNPFQLVSVGPDGAVRDLPTALLPARLQLFNNDPFPAFRSVDVYVNDIKVADDLGFRSATPYLTVPANQTVRIDFSPGAAADNAGPLFSTSLRVPAGSSLFGQLAGNPQAVAGTQVLQVFTADGRQAGETGTRASVLFAQGAGDTPPVDIKRRGVGTAADDVPANATDPDGYQPLPAAATTFDVTAADGLTRLGSFAADLSGFAGKAAVVATSGFLSPAAGDPGFGLVLVPVAGGKGTVLPRAAPFAPPTGYAAGGTQAGRPLVRRFAPDGATAGTMPAAGTGSPRVALVDVTGDGVAETVVGSGPGAASQVTVIDGKTGGTVLAQFQPFETTFTGGVFVAGGDLDGDGRPDLVVTPDQGGGPRVDVYSGATFAKLTSFFAFRDDPNFRGGVRPAVGDVNADGRPDLTAAAGFGGGPRVSVFDGRTLFAATQTRLLPDFFAFESTLRNGAFAAVGDLDADGFGDLIFGAGPGGGPRVIGLSGRVLLTTGGAGRTLLANFFAADPGLRTGVPVSVADLDGDYQADLVVGLAGDGPQVRAFPGRTIAPGELPPPSAEATLFDAGSAVFVG